MEEEGGVVVKQMLSLTTAAFVWDGGPFIHLSTPPSLPLPSSLFLLISPSFLHHLLLPSSALFPLFPPSALTRFLHPSFILFSPHLLPLLLPAFSPLILYFLSCSLHPLPLSLFPPLFPTFLTVSVYLPPLFSLLLSSLLSLFSSAPPSFIPPLSLLNWLLSACFPLHLLLLLSIYILSFIFSSTLCSLLLLLKGDISPHRHTCDTKKNQSVTSLSKHVELLHEID